MAIPQSRISREYAHFNASQPAEYSDYTKYNIKWSTPEHYEIVSKVGRGKYSEVFQGIDVRTGGNCILKVLKPVRSSKIRREIKILLNLAGGTNVIRLLDCVCDPNSMAMSMVFEYISQSDFKSIIPMLTGEDIQHYMFELLRGLDFCNSRGIMHRDIKPQNLVVDHQRRKLRIIDWGLAEFYHPGVPNNVRVASRYFKAPELLIDYREYDYSVDMWSFGCVFGALIFQMDHLFGGSDNFDQLLKITRVLGSDSLCMYLKRCNKSLGSRFPDSIYHCPGIPWRSFINPQNRQLATPAALDLIDLTLQFDHHARLTPIEAMQHVYFADLIQRRKQQQQQQNDNLSSPSNSPTS